MNKLLSVCMIVKDEEKVLERCLESIHGIADEIVIVDTGSTDKTKEIAIKYTDKLYDFEWVNDFSKARNYAASKAVGEWILVIDADEYVDREKFEDFKSELKMNPPKQEINTVTIINFAGKQASSIAQNRHTRLYKNNDQIEFQRPIHEELKYLGTNEGVGFSDLQLFHTGYMKDTVDEKRKTERNLSILLDQKVKKGIDYYYIGNEYRKLNEIDKAILFYQKSYKERESNTADYLKKLLIYLIDALNRQSRYDEALEIITDAEKVYPNYADYKYFKGLIFYKQNNIHKAKSIFENILFNKDNLVVDHSEEYKEYLPLIHLAEIYEKENNLHKTVEYYSRAASIKSFNDALWSKLLYLLGKHSSLEELTDFINRKVVTSHNMTEKRMIHILLNTPLLNVQKLSRSLLDHENLLETENEALLLKNLLLDLNFEEIDRIINEYTLGETIVLFKVKIFSLEDYLIYLYKIKNENVMEVFEQINSQNKFFNIAKLLFEDKHGRMKLNNTEQNLFINIYRQATILNINDIIDKLDKKVFLLNKEQKNEIKNIRNL